MSPHHAFRFQIMTLGLFAASAALAGDRVDGAITLVTSTGPDYMGGRGIGTSIRPGFLLTWGRLTLSSSGGFAASRDDKVERGLGLALARTDSLRVDLGLRFDGGRNQSDSPALAGLGDIKPTVRARIAASWHFSEPWRVDSSWTIDAFGRGGGSRAELTLAREQWSSPGTQWSWGATATLGSQRYLQTYFGITAEQAARSRYPVYSPSAGLRDIATFVSVRTDIAAHWVVLGAATLSHLVGPAGGSPLVERATGWSVTAGLGYRF